MPGGEGWAGLHGRENVDQARLITPLLEDGANAVFLAEGPDRANELDLQAVLPGDPFRVLSDLLSQRLGKAGVVEETDSVPTQVVGHALRKADAHERARDDDATKAGEDTGDPAGVAFSQQRHVGAPLSTRWHPCKSSVSKHTSSLVSAMPS